jgi:molybdenum cofactor biosynthesis enzyme MoaA
VPELSREQSPAFVAFKSQAAQALASNPNLIRFDCLNPTKAVPHLFDFSYSPEVDCETAWRAYLPLRFDHGFRSLGVRDSLRKLFAGSLRGRTLSLPADVYPVYQMLARDAGIAFITYTTLPAFDLESALGTDTILLTAPLVPSGRDLTRTEITRLLEWLREKAERVVIIDRVYCYTESDLLQPLIDTGRVIVCYSLSKSHLSPLVSGFTISPEYFAPESVDSEEIQRATALLTRYRDFPQRQNSIFRSRWERLTECVRQFDPTWNPPHTGYLSVVRASHETLLARGVLAVPGAVYGTGEELSIVSCLHETHAANETEVVDRYHVLPLSNFARGYDKYSREYSKSQVLQSTFPDQFFLLPSEELHVGFAKAQKVLAKTAAGDRAIVLQTRVERHELRANLRTGLGTYVERNHVRVVRLLDSQLNELRIEDVYAESLELNGDLRPWSELRPRSVSVLPVARACQAKCAFCFSHSSVSEEQLHTKPDFAHVEFACEEAATRGATRFVITGGGEPTLLAHTDLLKLMRIGSRCFRTVVLITNGYSLGKLNASERFNALRDYRDNGLTVLAISRHSPDRNDAIMQLATRSECVAETWNTNREALSGLALRWVCVLQKGGVADERGLHDYISWVVASGADEVCFKELYVAANAESAYATTDYNTWCAAHQVPLSLVTDFMRTHGATKQSELPWGSPVYRLRWRGREITVAAYTEPSVFWERKNGVCRSWNLMADGTCYANLETTHSLITFGATQLPVLK